MKKKSIIIALSFLVVLCLTLAALTGCGVSTNPTNPSGPSSSNEPSQSTEKDLTLTKNAVNLVYGESAVVIAKYKTVAGKTLTWSSSNESVAVVEDGVITSVGLGDAVVTASYGEQKATCSVTVTYGEFQPVLTVERLGSELTLLKNDVYELSSSVSFNGKVYPCELTADITDQTVASFANGKITALKCGETQVKLKGVWNNFDTPLMQKIFTLTVIENDVTMYMTVEKGGEETVSDEVLLYVTDYFEGVNYINRAAVKFVVKENGTEKNGNLALTEGEGIVTLGENGTIIAQKIGEALITADYQNEGGVTYTKELKVKVECPVVTYDKHVEWTDETLKSVTSYFGEEAYILYAKQGSKELKHTKKQLIGVVFNGDQTEAVEVQTNKGGYVFEDIYGCNAVLTTENFVSELTLSTQVKDKYYAINDDIGTADKPIDLKDQKNATDAACFSGTFDGRGHTVYAGTYENGIFGGYGYGAVIKNTEFVITFKSDNANGLTSDKGRWAKVPKMNALIENVHIVTTNFGEGNHVMSTLRVELLKMKDVLVEVNGVENIADFDGRDNLGVLFEIDFGYQELMNGNAALECFDNVRVVVDKFLPMANGRNWNDRRFLNFAVNDEKQFGTITRKSTNRDSCGYCVVTEVQYHSDWLSEMEYAVDSTQPDGYEYANCIFFCYGLKRLDNGGIYRYNTIQELKNDGVTQVGDWIVD